MIKFFRKIRQNLISENKFSKYLIYAIGEIILVVIGILIALSINSWNQGRIDKKSEYKYLKDIKKEIQNNNYILDFYIKNRLPNKIEGLLSAKKYSEENIEIKDTIAFLNTVTKGGMITNGLGILSRNTYNELLSTGNFQLVSKDSIKIKVKNYYWGLDADDSNVKTYKSDITKFTTGLRPYNSSNPEYISKYDSEEMMVAFRSVEFRKIIDRELSYAYNLKNKIDGLIEEGLEIIELINTELKEK
ncbi:hypothetical protein KO504_01130 [Winogradskyella psychrotolerans]|uniref:DUF6090 family protein n=1 Tax=Winogradskyella psychrotolerans TaxID=1344585 RepID=UPI001C07091B|nr:DUF6090 family protein [Winogradskyella psychrotolerans]MBU2919931.1 hypothetical protein [Winogradskyella psychrotolerans]